MVPGLVTQAMMTHCDLFTNLFSHGWHLAAVFTVFFITPCRDMKDNFKTASESGTTNGVNVLEVRGSEDFEGD